LLDGVDDNVSIPDPGDLNFGASHDFTVALWVNLPQYQRGSNDAENSILEKWSGSRGYPFVIRLFNQNNSGSFGRVHALRCDGNAVASVVSTSRVNDNRWHHIAFVCRDGILYLLIDGVIEGSMNDSVSADTTNTSPLYLGSRGSSYYLTGALDEVAV